MKSPWSHHKSPLRPQGRTPRRPATAPARRTAATGGFRSSFRGCKASPPKSGNFPTWWLIPLSKWNITPVISGLTLLIPFITGVITHLLSGMSHQVLKHGLTGVCWIWTGEGMLNFETWEYLRWFWVWTCLDAASWRELSDFLWPSWGLTHAGFLRMSPDIPNVCQWDFFET